MIHIPLSGVRGAGLCVRVDDGDAESAAGYSWHLIENKSGNRYANAYVRGSGRANRRNIRLHTLLTGWSQVDHEDGDGLNCTRANMRPASRGQNNVNSGSRGGASRYKGVYWEKRWGFWYAKIQVNHQQRRLGGFGQDEQAAARAYDVAALEAWGPFARLIVPPV